MPTRQIRIRQLETALGLERAVFRSKREGDRAREERLAEVERRLAREQAERDRLAAELGALGQKMEQVCAHEYF